MVLWFRIHKTNFLLFKISSQVKKSIIPGGGGCVPPGGGIGMCYSFLDIFGYFCLIRRENISFFYFFLWCIFIKDKKTLIHFIKKKLFLVLFLLGLARKHIFFCFCRAFFIKNSYLAIFSTFVSSLIYGCAIHFWIHFCPYS